MKQRTKAIIATLTLGLMLPFMMIPASANSRSPYWEGENSEGTIFMEDDIPIQVVSEKLTFDIPTLPYTDYRSGEYFIEYDSKVTAEYTFYNPTDMTITAKMLFPYGKLPEYANLRDKDGNSLVAAEHEKYQITVNGEAVEKTVRYSNITSSFYDDYSDFAAEEEIRKISDEYLTVGNWGPDTTVTKYTIDISGIDQDLIDQTNTGKYPHKYAKLTIYYNETHSSDPTLRERAIYTNDGNKVSTKSNGKVNNNIYLNRNISFVLQECDTTISFIVIGEPLNEYTKYEFTYFEENRETEDTNTPIEVSYNVTTATETLEEYTRSIYKNDSGILFVDWFNSIIIEILGDYSNLQNWVKSNGVLSRWYEYEITIGPGEYLTNAVTAPVYPNIDTDKYPNQYDYVYLLSPASGFASFGTLEIIINTDYNFLESNLGEFEKTKDGYKMTLDGLPRNDEDYLDLYFTIEGNVPSKQPNPNPVLEFFENVGSFILSIMFVIVVYIIEGIGWIIGLFR